jgi:ATP-binding cassette subfamily A (ABC1) protein 3
MQFLGGSAICCVDEVSTGLDPISRRRIWEILLAERDRRTIILTTHYLDEADFLADDIAIMFKGSLRASGTSASLKHTYGDGYTLKLPYHSDLEPQISGDVHREQSRHQTVYRVSTAALVTELVEQMEKHNLHDYQLSGPTMEELFIKVTGETIHAADDPSDNETVANTKAVAVNVSEKTYELSEGKPISVFKQWWILLNKRFRIFKRRWVPYLVAVAFAIAGAGVAPLLIKSIKHPMKCPQPSDLIYDYVSREDFGTGHYNSDYTYSYPGAELYRLKYVFGPRVKLDDKRLDLLASVYSINNTRSYGSTSTYGYKNSTQIKDEFVFVNTYDEFKAAIRNNWKAVAAQSSQYSFSRSASSAYTTIKGGVWMGDENSSPTVLVNVRSTQSSSQMLNMYNILTSGVGISGSYYSFATTKIPSLINIKPLMFIIYFGLIMAW